MAELTTLKADEGALRAMLERAGVKTWKGRACCCPFHDDKHPSAGIFSGEDGFRFKCQVCGVAGDLFDIQARIEGKPLSDVLKSYTDQQQPGTRRLNPVPPEKPLQHFTLAEIVTKYGPQGEKVFVYSAPGSKAAEMVIIRIDEPTGKRFLQCSPNGDGLVMKAPPKPWPLYNRTRVAKSDRVVVVEGEKCVHALHALGIIATTSPGGSKNAANADWSPLADKCVVIWPDNDEAGLEYASDVRKMLDALPLRPSVSQIDPASTGLGAKGDVADYVQSVSDLPVKAQAAAVENMLAEASDMGAGAEWVSIWDDTLAGRRRAISWHMGYLDRNTQALLPGTVTLLCGAGGASKSFLVIQWAMCWYDDGLPVAIYELEGERAEHLQRAAAQIAKDPRILDSKWAEENPDYIRQIKSKYEPYMSKFGNCITAAPDDAPSLDDIADWVEKQALAGKQIIIVDPITAATAADKAWLADSQFILRVKAILRKTRARLLLVMHPRKGHKGIGLDELAGGAIYGRLCNSALWLERHEPPIDATVSMPGGPQTFQINRTITILKARHGRGAGHKIALTFSHDSLTYLEHGLTVPKSKAEPDSDDHERHWEK
jgi:KaiC/GvpD/RAD55 family RecA-like ATPase